VIIAIVPPETPGTISAMPIHIPLIRITKFEKKVFFIEKN
jgi:hypothetical protein